MKNTATAPAPLSPALKQLYVRVALAARSLSIGGHDDFNQGQVSARLPGSTEMVIKSALTGFDECTPDDLIMAPVDASAAAPAMAPPELALHQAI